jgi:hypothetical protein
MNRNGYEKSAPIRAQPQVMPCHTDEGQIKPAEKGDVCYHFKVLLMLSAKTRKAFARRAAFANQPHKVPPQTGFKQVGAG